MTVTVYVDSAFIPHTVNGHKDEWCHLFSDQLDPTELHEFAQGIGLKREWFQPGRTPVEDHYDVTRALRRHAFLNGATPTELRHFIEILAAKRKEFRAAAGGEGVARMISVRRVIGIDPGGTTGVAVVSYVNNGDGSGGFVLSWAGQLTREEALPRIGDMITKFQPDAVAVEGFIVSNRSARSRSAGAGEFARELIGAVIYGPGARHAVLTHTASQVKRWATDKRLDAAGLLAQLKGQQHARDAARHALITLVERDWAPDPLSPSWARSTSENRS